MKTEDPGVCKLATGYIIKSIW